MCNPIWPWNLTYEHYSRSLNILWSKAPSSVYLKYESNRAKWKVYMLWTMPFCMVWYDVDPWLTTFIQVGGTFFDHRHSVNEVWAMLDQWKRRYAPDKDFVYNSTMTSTLTLETRVTAYPLRKGTLLGEIWTWLNQGEKRFALDKRFRTGWLNTKRRLQSRDLIR